MPLLTCSSLLLFYSLLLSLLFFGCLCLLFVFCADSFKHWGWAMWMYSDLSPLVSWFFCIFTGSSSIGVLCWSFQLQTSSLCALPFSPALSLCCSSDHCCVTCMTSVILLTFSSSTLTVCDLPLCLVSHAFMRSHRSRRGWGPDFWMFTQMCFISGAVLDRQNVITCCMYSSNYDFLFSCCLSSLSLCLCCSTLLYEKLLSIPFSSRLPHFFYF